ncbi:MAG TPA: PAS domain-containing protein, partial [Bacteroidales bacterium]|nr:PAS domain-containing protein [Bacteroidales bacterium]
MAKLQSIKENQLLNENRELRLRLREAEETLNAIRNGEVDAIVVSGSGSEKVFSLTSAETPYRYLVEDMKEGAITLSAEGLVLYCNHSFEELVSIPMEQIVGTNFKRFINKDDWPLYDNLLLLSNERKKEEILYYPCSDEPKYLHLSFYPIPEGELGKICVIVSDVTELKKFEHDLQLLVDERTTDLKKAIKQLNEAIATKDKLFSIIAHDLRGPFTALLGFSEMLVGNARKYDTGQFEMMVTNIHAAAKSAYTLMENLLLWTMAQTEQIQFKPEKIHLATV